MGARWTSEQEDVITSRNESLLVSAAAGAGKTAVLVERIIRLITDPENPVDIDRLLVLTFTNAAAAEMRERIRDAVEEKLLADPENERLLRQHTLVNSAHIQTIDSFCLSVLKDKFHAVGLEPGFRIGDDNEMKLMREDACDKTLEEFYEKRDADFIRFVEGYTSARDDKNIRTYILELYNYAMSYPWPEEWLLSASEQYDVKTQSDLYKKEWMQSFIGSARETLSLAYGECKRALKACDEPGGPYVYKKALLSDLDYIGTAIKGETYGDLHEALSGHEYAKLTGGKHDDIDTGKRAAVKKIRDAYKESLSALAAQVSGEPEIELSKIKKTRDAANVLIRLVLRFSEIFKEEKEKKNVIDFSDAEHLALNVMVDPEAHEETAAARDYRKQFKAVMVDEYQDINFAQEKLISSLTGMSEGVENYFMVGDIKQSIYRFRMAKPQLFREKSVEFGNGKVPGRRLINLSKNFRSRPEVVRVVNDVFETVMQEDIGHVEYDEKAKLVCGGTFDEPDTPGIYDPEFIMMTGNLPGKNARASEAYVAAKRIKRLVEDQEIPGIKYGDIALLLRSVSGWDEAFVREFESLGVPLAIVSKTGYFTAPEVQTMLSLLRILDNPLQDIPLASVMTSQIGGFSEAELALIKACSDEKTFCRSVAAGDTPKLTEADAYLAGKLKRFREFISEQRRRVSYTPIHELIRNIYKETGYRDIVSAQPYGEVRRANLDMLAEKASAFEKTSYHGLASFVRYIDSLVKYEMDEGEARAASEDAVHFMTVHSSKGLEFPVVVLCGMGKKMNFQDVSGDVVLNDKYGIGMRYIDTGRRTKSDTLIRRSFALAEKEETLGEEQRMLYVAMTRAKQKLIMLGSGKEEDIAAAEREACEPGSGIKAGLSYAKRLSAKCWWDWVLPAVAGKYEIKVWSFDEEERGAVKRELGILEKKARVLEELKAWQGKTDAEEEIRKILSWEYPYKGEAVPKQKISVSELKRSSRLMESEELAGEEGVFSEDMLYPAEIPVPYLPSFVKEREENGGIQRGNAMHRFMQCIDLANINLTGTRQTDIGSLKELAAHIGDKSLMSAGEIEKVNFDKIRGFLSSPLGERAIAAAKGGEFFREQPFTLLVPASEIWEETKADENVIIQGIIDAYWEEKGGVVLLDYKTDKVQDASELIEKYKVQIELYRRALECSGRTVKEAYLWSFSTGEACKVQK